MRAMRATLSGQLTPGDHIMLHYCAARGGRTTAGHYVTKDDTIESVLDGLIKSAKTYFLSESEVKIKGQTLSIITTREDGDWIAQVEGAKTESFTLEVIG